MATNRARLMEIDEKLATADLLPHQRGLLLHEALNICDPEEWYYYKKKLEGLQQKQLKVIREQGRQ